MDYALIDTQLREALQNGASVDPTTMLSVECIANIQQIRTKCLEYQGSDSTATVKTRGGDLGGWRRGAGGGGGGGDRDGSRFKGESFSSKSKPAIVVPINMKGGTVSNTRGAWTAAAGAKKHTPSSGESATEQVPQTTDQGVQANVYKIPSHSKGNFNKSREEVESKILNNLVLCKLNKFTKENYEDIKEFLEQILSNDETEFLKDFMILVFKKATKEKLFCPLYVKLISELCEKHPIIKVELMKLYNTYLKEFEKVEEENGKEDDYDEFCELQSEKLYRLGYGQFLGELTKKGVLDGAALVELYKKILETIGTYTVPGMNHRNQVDQMAACLSSITSVFKKEKNPALMSICQIINKNCGANMRDIINRGKKGELPGLSPKARFALMDCDDIFVETSRV